MKIALLTKPGGRSENQDAAGYVSSGGLLIACVCDGLGGHGGGKIAANAARDAILTSSGSPGQRIEAANGAVLRANAEYPNMRTTAVVWMMEKSEARWAHCGDSRLYRIREGRIEQMTFDHSVPEMLVRTGEITRGEIRRHEDRARLTRALGVEVCRWDEGGCEVLPGDKYLLVTDGFWEPVTEEDILACLTDDPEQTLALLETLLLDNVSDGNDNYTALAVYL